MQNSVLNFLNDFSVLLRIKREKFSSSQSEMAKKLGISLRTYQRIECGESEPSLSNVYKLAHILKFDVSEIFHFEQQSSDEIKLLHQSSQEIELLAKLSKVGSWSIDITTGKCSWSKIIREILEIPPAYDLDLNNVWQFFRPGRSVELARSTIDTCIETCKPFNIEVEIVTSKGDIRNCIITGIPEMLEGKVVRIYGLFQDDTNSKNLQKELSKLLGNFNEIHSFAGFGCWNLNHKTNLSLCSPSMYPLFGIDLGDNESVPDEVFLNAIYHEDRPLVDSTFKKSLEIDQTFEVEFRILLPNGDIKWLLGKFKTEFGFKGTPTHSIGYNFDITKFKINTNS